MSGGVSFFDIAEWLTEHVLALKADEFSVRLKTYKRLRVKFGDSYSFSIQVIVTSYSLVEK